MWDKPVLTKLSIAIVIVIANFSQLSLANDQNSHAFNDGVPFGLQDIPPGRTREKIESLAPQAQERAVEWLNRFSFPEGDFDFINVDDEGGIFYEDTTLPDSALLKNTGLTENESLTDNTDLADGSPTAVQDPVVESALDVFALHSKPGANNTLFVDFDGHEITGTAWNGSGVSSYYAAAFSLDGDDSTFSETDSANIQEIWHRIAEDFASFDIDVTTEEPAIFSGSTGHLLITRDTDTTGQAMPYDTAGGVAYVGVWGSSSFSYYSPALVYYDNLANFAPYISEAASHEAGHNLALSHDGSATSSYYSGHGSGDISWAPIMGVGYYNNVTQWSKGEYSGTTNTQDDLSILTSYLGLSIDDHSDATNTATELTLTGGTLVEASNPQIDPNNLYPENKGIIEDRNDVDIFTFVSGGGTIDISATPAWDAFSRTSRRGANLDIELSLLDDSGVVAVSDPTDNTDAQLIASLSSGRYYLEVTGVGSSSSPYSDYGSLGQYFLSGNIPGTTNDTTAPNPDPMSWASTPTAIDRGSIEMAATLATDDSGVVEYQFICIAGGSGCTSSAWQSSPFYTATGLIASTTYSYQVVARDLYNNLTIGSASSATTTPSNASPNANDDTAVTLEDASVNISVLANDSDPEGDSLNVESASQGSNGTTTINGNTVTYTPNANFSGMDSFSYTADDGYGGTASAIVTVTVNDQNDPPTAVNDSASVGTNSSVTIDVLSNDSDPENDVLTLVSVSSGNKGTTSVSGNSVIYTSGKKRGSDTLTYSVSDGTSTSTATISISISRGGTSDDGGGGGGSGKCHPKRGC